jgi:hypothetical protein
LLEAVRCATQAPPASFGQVTVAENS